ncbi:hypothetical protein THTE_2588 [Thermogutta terrifontis]|uniref:Uncharacterized protein n=1 Tax=Thermogutta terrifontis TaxID=1331910 RepID=A0A286RGW6_9BACT|nr:hypothetical protein THTE_2588 [Thermogutta terrifontis]
MVPGPVGSSWQAVGPHSSGTRELLAAAQMETSKRYPEH